MKDFFVGQRWTNGEVPVPRTHALGFSRSLDQYFAITTRAPGVIWDTLSPSRAQALLAELLGVLSALHQVPPPGAGAGHWLPSGGEALFDTWPAYLRDQAQQLVRFCARPSSASRLSDYRQLFHDKIEACPMLRYWVHGDFGFSNVVVHQDQITGVLDWAESLYGDYVYDLAWLVFWGQSLDYQAAIHRHYSFPEDAPKNLRDRLECYQLLIGLKALRFFHTTHQPEKYQWVQGRLAALYRKA